ncbi:MAG: DUF5667 domain-containing protein [Patescibacteria group bacterium]
MNWLESDNIKLEEKLLELGKTMSLSEDRSKALRQKIFASLKSPKPEEFGFSKILAALKTLSQEVKPREYFRFVLREKLMAVAEFSQTKRFSRWFNGLHSKRLVATLTAVVFVMTVIFNFTFKVNRVEASYLTMLDAVSGEVSVIRGDKTMPGAMGFLLKADDVIRTGPGSSASILFLDQSVSRLDENTEIRISKLFANPLNKTETLVEVVLNHGQLWSRVINLIDNFSHFQVKAQNALAVAKKKAAFSVSISSKGKAKVSAIKNRVELVVATDKKVVETTLVKGFDAEVKMESNDAPKIISQEGKIPTDWVAQNLAQDDVYIESVKQDVKDQLRDQVTMLPWNPMYAVKEFSENTKIALTFDGLDRQKKILTVAQEKLAEAEVYLENGDKERSQRSMNEFRMELQGTLDWMKQIELAQPDKVSDIKAHIDDVLSGYEKQLSVILPNDQLYDLKVFVGNMKVLSAGNPAAQTEERLSQAVDKLLEAHDLVDQGNSAEAAEQVKAYTSAVSDVISDVKNLSNDEKEKAVTALLDNKIEDLKVLQAIITPPAAVGTTTPSLQTMPPSTPPTNQPEAPVDVSQSALPTADDAPLTSVTTFAQQAKNLQQTVADAKTEALTKLGEAVLDIQQGQNSVTVLQKLQDIKQIDVNGKPFLNVTLNKGRLMIRSDKTVISIVGTSTPPTETGDEVSVMVPSPVVTVTTTPSSVAPMLLPKEDSKNPASPLKLP